jgi:endo-1,3-1,4-beta-glycanase ExoK
MITSRRLLCLSLITSSCLAAGAAYATEAPPGGGPPSNCITRPPSAPQHPAVAETFTSYDSSLWLKANWANASDPAFDTTFASGFATFNANGKLVLKLDDVVAGGADDVEFLPDGTQVDLAYTGAHYQSTDRFGYGTFEIVMKGTETPGLVSSFFLYQDNPSVDPNQEIDVEFTGETIQFTYVLGSLRDEFDYVYDPATFSPSADYHSYKIVWRSGSIAWLIDDVEVHRVQGACTPYAEMKVMMNIWVTDPAVWDVGAFAYAAPVKAHYDAFNFTPSLN